MPFPSLSMGLCPQSFKMHLDSELLHLNRPKPSNKACHSIQMGCTGRLRDSNQLVPPSRSPSVSAPSRMPASIFLPDLYDCEDWSFRRHVYTVFTHEIRPDTTLIACISQLQSPCWLQLKRQSQRESNSHWHWRRLVPQCQRRLKLLESVFRAKEKTDQPFTRKRRQSHMLD